MIAATIVLLLAAGGIAPVEPPIHLAQLIVRESIVVRVRSSAPPQAIKWKEKKAPKCMSAEGLAGAALMGPDTIDLIARGGQRFRVKLASACPAIDFYKGFYLAPSKDRKICAERDAIHARSGGQCQIRRFRKLVPDD